MATHFKVPKIFAYKEIKQGKFKDTRHYQLEPQSDVALTPSKFLNISRNRMFAKSKPIYWVKNHNGKKWNKKMLTGLFQTDLKETYFGDIDKRKHLIIFHFLDDGETLFVYLFENFYTRNLKQILEYIKTSYTTTIE